MGEYVLYDSTIELHLLGGYWWEETSLGAALARDFWGATWRLETLWIKTHEARKSNEVQVGGGVEFALNEKMSIVSELFYQSEGKSNSVDYKLVLDSRFQTLRASFYNYSLFQYKFSELWTISEGLLLNLIDGSHYFIWKTQYSLSENTDLLFEIDLPRGKKGSEFSDRSFTFMNGASVGAPIQVSLGIKAYF